MRLAVRHGTHPTTEYYSVPCDHNVEAIPTVIARECADNGVNFLGATAGTNIAILLFSRRIKRPHNCSMTINDISKQLEEIGRDDLAKAILPPSRSGHLRTDREIAILIAQVHDRALGKEVDFSAMGCRKYNVTP